MRRVQACLALLAVGPAAQADGTDVPTSISLIETTVLACIFDTRVEVVGLRRGLGGHLQSLGTWDGADVVQDGSDLLLTRDGMSLRIADDRATWERDGGTAEGDCHDVTGAVLALVEAMGGDPTGWEAISDIGARFGADG